LTELYDPFSRTLHEDPYPVYKTLRDDYPAYYCEARRCWALSRFADVWQAVHDPVTFSSAQGVFPGFGDMNNGSILPILIMMDPPRHTQLRTLVNKAFAPRRILDREAVIRSVARALIDDFSPTGGLDLVENLAMPLPSIVIADLLGIPRGDRGDFRRWSDQLIQLNPDDAERAQAFLEAGVELTAYLDSLIGERRPEPGDDLISVLIRAEEDGQRLSGEEILGLCILLLVAGNETTTNLISNSAVIFAEHPDQWKALVVNPALFPNAIDECLRFDSPVQALARTLTCDIEFHGQKLRTGEKVLLIYGSANRDEREFVEPDRFDIDRAIPRQLAFGHGIHVCLGASLARLEARVAFSELASCAPEWRISGPPHRLHSGPIRGLRTLPVSLG
jgi:cytochrome P450